MMEWISLAAIIALTAACLILAIAFVKRDRTFVEAQQAVLLAQEAASRHVETAVEKLRDAFGEIMKQERAWHISAVTHERERASTLWAEADQRMRAANQIIMAAKAPNQDLPFDKIRQAVSMQVRDILKNLYMPGLGQPPGPQGHPASRPRGKTMDTTLPLEGFVRARRNDETRSAL